MKIFGFGYSDIGQVRRSNEDRFLIDQERLLFAVADGMGGLPGGALASQTAIETLEKNLDAGSFFSRADLEAIFQNINQQVINEGRAVHGEMGIGTTLTVISIEGRDMKIAHVGDSAAYLFRNGSSKKMTIDHTVEEELQSRSPFPHRLVLPEIYSHTLTRCIGQPGNINVDLVNQTLYPGDRVLLCTDGITRPITVEEIRQSIATATDPETYIRELIDLANSRGAPDNATAIAIFVEGEGQTETP